LRAGAYHAPPVLAARPPDGAPVKAVQIEEQLHCLGYFGFGGGWALARGKRFKSGEIYCSSECPLRAPCWDKHRERVRGMVDACTAEFDALVDAFGGDGRRAVKYWHAMHKSPDPYSAVLLGNTQDGGSVASGGKPRDRGEFTLQWPLKVLP